MSDLRKALEQLAANLRHDAANHGADVRHPRVVLENRAADVERLLAAHPEPAPLPVIDREAVLRTLANEGVGSCKLTTDQALIDHRTQVAVAVLALINKQ